VRTFDPDSGPFTDIELEALRAALNDSFATGRVSLEDYVLAWLAIALGARPTQLAMLKIADFCVATSKDGTPMYALRVPHAKQRGIGVRSQFTERLLVPQIGKLISRYVDQLREAFRDILSDPNQAPLFPADLSGGQAPAGFEHHRAADNMAQKVKRVLERLGVVSERTGKAMKVNVARLRRTLGTRAAMEGHGELVIAELLDHSDTQNVGIYVEARPEIIDRIDKAIALRLAPMAQAFAGMVVTDEDEAERGDDSTSRITDPRFCPTMKPMGTCGKHGFCGLLAPIACYTCRNFQPWVDGPHEAVLDHLLGERERLMSKGDHRIAAINDRTILAAAEVVRQCRELRQELEGTGDV
jgi:hypothetical protein